MHATVWLCIVNLLSAAGYAAEGSLLPLAGVAIGSHAQRRPQDCRRPRMPQRQQEAVTAADQEAAASALVGRLLPAEAASPFRFRVEKARQSERAAGGHGGFMVVGRGGSILVAGNSGADLAAGVYWFLKYRCRRCIVWLMDTQATMRCLQIAVALLGR